MGFCANGLGLGGWGHMGSWGHMGGWTGLGWLGPLFGLSLFIGLIGLLVVGTVWLVRRTTQQPVMATQAGQNPLELARRRLATGEITPDEFEDLRQRLQS